MDSSALNQLKEISAKIATELVFADPGSDAGLLPINSLVSDLERLLESCPAEQVVVRAVAAARQCLDQVFETSGVLSAETLEWFGQWVGCWDAILVACENGGSAPEIPPLPSPGGTQPACVESTAPTEANPGLKLNLEQDGELLREFINESQEHLQNIEEGLLLLENDPSDSESLNAIFRAFHTIKGGAGFLNLEPAQKLAHELESLLDLIRQGKLSLDKTMVNLILEGGDTLKRFVDEIAARVSSGESGAEIVVPTDSLLRRVRTVLASFALGQVASQVQAELASPSSADPVGAAGPDETEGKNSRQVGTAAAVKVDTVKLDSLVDLVGEMVIAQSLLVQNRAITTLESEEVGRNLALLGRITKDLQRTVMSLRMVPIRASFQKMNRLVRDVAARTGKQVQLLTEGEDTELDRTIVEEISDPLIHMVRNAIDHGLETPEERTAAGKPATGTLLLKASHRGGNIVIEVRDDGKGLNRERILAKAIEKGLLKPGEHLAESQVLGLILKAGFSTAEKITDLSGRGVGMDVVRRNIEKLRGKIEIQSTPGQGSIFTIYLPLTLAIIDGLLVSVGEQRYILPTLLVRESFRPAREMISTVHGRGELINVRGSLCPLLRLHEHVGVKPRSTDPTQCIAVVVEAGNETRCVLVDDLLGKQEVVIKSLGDMSRRNRWLAGAAILGNGQVGLILDPQALVHPETVMEAAA